MPKSRARRNRQRTGALGDLINALKSTEPPAMHVHVPNGTLADLLDVLQAWAQCAPSEEERVQALEARGLVIGLYARLPREGAN